MAAVALAKPKSITLTFTPVGEPLPSMSMRLPGLRSRWINPPARRRHQRRGYLPGDFQGGVHVERSVAAHARLERFTLDEFHRVRAAVGLLRGTELIDSGHMGITQGGRRPRLAQKPFAQGRGVSFFNGGGVTELDDL